MSNLAAPETVARCACGLVAPVWMIGTQRRCLACVLAYAHKLDERQDHYNCKRKAERLQERLDAAEAELFEAEGQMHDLESEAERLRERLADFISRGEV